jgi:hypothetical protein
MRRRMDTVQGFGDWADFYGFFDENIFGQALLKVGTGAAQVAVGSLITGALGQPTRLQSGQVFYAPYGTLPGAAPIAAASPATVAASTGLGAAAYPGAFEQIAPTDYTPWIVAGAGALLLLVILS